MNNNLFNNSNVFNGTAQYYSNYRPDYPQDMVDMVMKEVGCKTSDRMLDLGCGTGKVALAFSRQFNEIIAADINEEMVQEAIRVSREKGVSNINWLVKTAEEVDKTYGKFDLVTFGASFHWMDRERVAHTCFELLNNNGVLAILEFGRGFKREESEWKGVIQDTIQKWIGKEKESIGNMIKTNMKTEKAHEDVLRELPFSDIKTGNVIRKNVVNIETIIGYLYSTSYCSRRLLGEKLDDFERDLINALYEISPEGLFEENLTGDYIICKK